MQKTSQTSKTTYQQNSQEAFKEQAFLHMYQNRIKSRFPQIRRTQRGEGVRTA